MLLSWWYLHFYLQLCVYSYSTTSCKECFFFTLYKIALKICASISEEMTPIKCTEGWLPYASHCYSIQRESKAWKDALTSCKRQGGDLASVHSITEYSFLVSLLGYSEYISGPLFCLAHLQYKSWASLNINAFSEISQAEGCI